MVSGAGPTQDCDDDPEDREQASLVLHEDVDVAGSAEGAQAHEPLLRRPLSQERGTQGRGSLWSGRVYHGGAREAFHFAGVEWLSGNRWEERSVGRQSGSTVRTRA